MCIRDSYLFGEGKTQEAADRYGLPLLAQMPIDPALAALVDAGRIEDFQGSWLSAAADRRSIDTEETSFRRYLPLVPVFSHMNGEHPGKAVPPALQTGALHLPLENLDALTAAQYQAAVDALAQRLAELSRTEQWLNSLLCLLESYLSAFPSSTNTAESPDISLFDHLKTTAAIGVCISEYLAAEQETQFKKRLFDLSLIHI